MSTTEKKISSLRSKFSVALLRPDLGAIVGVVLVFLFFFLVAVLT